MSNTSPTKITAAVIGCGKALAGYEGCAIGHYHGKDYLDCGHPVRLLGVDLSPENLAAFGKVMEIGEDALFASTDALYAACVPDVVSICTWPPLHAPMAIEAMERGVRGVIIEKPLALNPAEIESIRQAARKSGAVVAVAHQRRHAPYFQSLKTLAASGKLGDNLRLEGHVGNGWDILSWTSHWFDIANFVFDAFPGSVLAGMDINQTRRYGHAIEDASIVYADYGNNREGVFLTGPREGAEIRLIGSAGMAFDGGDHTVVLTSGGVEQIAWDGPDRGFKPLFAEVIAALDGGPEPLCSIERCAPATLIAYAAHESARTGKRVAFPPSVSYAPLEVAQHPVTSALRGLRTLVYADAHYGGGGREGLAQTLEELTGTAPKVIAAESVGLTATDLEGIDALFIYHTQEEADEATRSALSAWVRAGKPLFPIHGALGAWPSWDEFRKWCGLCWEWDVSHHPYEAVTLRAVNGAERELGLAEVWLPRDEVYVALKEESPVRVLLEADWGNDQPYPAAWQTKAHPSVWTWMPGHLQDSWKVPGMRRAFEAFLLAGTRG